MRSVFNSTRKDELLFSWLISTASHAYKGPTLASKIAMPTGYWLWLVNSSTTSTSSGTSVAGRFGEMQSLYCGISANVGSDEQPPAFILVQLPSTCLLCFLEKYVVEGATSFNFFELIIVSSKGPVEARSKVMHRIR